MSTDVQYPSRSAATVKSDLNETNRAMEGWSPMRWPAQPVRVTPPSRGQLLKLRLLILVAAVSVIGLLAWLMNPDRVGDPAVYLMLTGAMALRAFASLFEWYNYWAISAPPVLRPRRRWAVDMLTTACPGEPIGMIARTLKAMTAVRYPHKNYLCDEGNDPRLKKICDELGVIHVTREEKKNAKAGNINNALAQCTGQIAVVLDPDHEPAPYLLHRTLGYFEDPAVGFVQSVQAYRNAGDSFVARGAAEQSYHFYGPFMMGMHGHGTVQAIGANCVFRRVALDTISGHAPGLAEDMHTAMRLFSKGWRSVYVPEILTRGLVPSTLGAFYKQQLKWSCGVFDLLFQEYPSLFKGFNLRQKIHFLLCPIFFLRGLVGLLEMVVPVLCLSYGLIAWRATLPQILAAVAPMLILGMLVRLRVQRWLLEPRERGIHLAGGVLATATWWVYLVGVLCAVFRIKVPYIPTPKEDKPSDAGDVAMPNFIAGGILTVAVVIGVYRDSSPAALFMGALGSANAIALIYVSIIAQQSTLRALRRRLSMMRKVRDVFVRPVIRVLGRLYDVVLGQIREGRVIPAAIALTICAGYVIAMVRPQAQTIEVPFELNKNVNVGGFYTGIDLGDTQSTRRSSRLASLQKGLDFNFRIVALNQWWTANADADFPITMLKEIRRGGAIPMINWLPSSHGPDAATVRPGDRAILKSIAAGRFDDYIRRFADDVRAFGEPVLICFAPQPDNPQMPWSVSGGNRPADFIAAWRRILTTFDSEGATNAGWVWNPASAQSMDFYFPGEAGEGYVDWIAVSGANGADAGASSFGDIYEPFRSRAKAWHLPVMIMDLDAPKADADRAGWMQDAMSRISRFYPEIKAVVFRDSSHERAEIPGALLDPGQAGNSGWTDDSLALSSMGEGLKLAPFSDGGARALSADQTLWGDLQPVRSPSPCVRGSPGHFSLMIDGAPYYIKGIAYNPGHDWRDADVPLSHRELSEDFRAIRAMGGNTIRRYGETWSDRNIFNAASDNGLKVLYGFWFVQDVDYLTDTEKEAAYERQIEETVLEYRDHPGLLGWCLGNEVWGLLKHEYGQPYLTEVRHSYVLFVQRMAQRIKELDPNHPVFCANESTQIAGAISDFAKGAPAVDVIAVNSYYEPDISHLKEIAARIDPTRPYLVSEFGPNGYWENKYNEYDAGGGLVEDTAIYKAWLYSHRWREYIQPNAGWNVGGIAYCWRDRYEGTATWFGIADLDGRLKPAYFALKYAWWNPDPKLNGTYPYGGPRIVNVEYPTDPQWPHEPFLVRTDVKSYNGEQPQYHWTVSGPGFAADVGHIVPLRGGADAMIDLPGQPGDYRIQLEVITPSGMDEANIPVRIGNSHTHIPWRQGQGNP